MVSGDDDGLAKGYRTGGRVNVDPMVGPPLQVPKTTPREG
jgi:hypothetical protein